MWLTDLFQINYIYTFFVMLIFTYTQQFTASKWHPLDF